MMLQTSEDEDDSESSSEGEDPADVSTSERSGDTADTLADIAHRGWRELAWRLCEFQVSSRTSTLVIEML